MVSPLPGREEREEAGASPREGLEDDLGQVLGRNLRRLRTRRGLSLERLSKVSGVSRAMLGQIELGRSIPTIALLWKVAKALSVPFAALTGSSGQSGMVVLRRGRSKVLASADGAFTSRALFPYDSQRRVELYELALLEGAVEQAEPHAPGTVENLVVSEGSVEVASAGEVHRLEQGDAVLFEADVAHSYRNVGTGLATMYLVMIYADTVG